MRSPDELALGGPRSSIDRWLRRFHPRLWSNDELRRWMPALPPGLRVINVAGWEDRDKEGGYYRDYFPSPAIYEVSNYDGDSKRGVGPGTSVSIDLDEPLPERYAGAYDLAFHHTVLEHLADPVRAFAQIARLTTDLVVTVVPFKQKMHFEPGAFGDYYRFSPMAMRRLHEQNGLTVLYESFTPPPALDVYLFYIGSKQPAKHAAFRPRLADTEALNQVVGSLSATALLQNVVARALRKGLRMRPTRRERC
jgi:hypothetical protein